MRVSISLLGVAALICTTHCAWADELEEVLVTATRSARSLTEVP